MKTQIYLAAPRGFCGGVSRAVNAVEKLQEKEKENIYVYHEIVHNRYIIENFQNKGINFINSLSQLPENAKSIIFSAHGVTPEIINQAKNLNLKIIDATCPLVDLVHKRIKALSEKGYTILLIGHIGHDEVVGSMGWFTPKIDYNNQKIIIVDSIETAKNIKLENSEKIAWVSQTTLSVDDTSEIVGILKKKFPNIREPKSSFICYATQNRQAAVKELINKVSSMIVIGSKNSSNTSRLYEIAVKKVPTYQIEDARELEEYMITEKTGITAGASVPKLLVDSVLDKISQISTVTKIIEQNSASEELKFKPVQL
ncbi:MAG: 4-hydroxy-3-methylbut-2-enyl diphosphate reductase [Bifidobacteriaceae bacterium]|jgi:4-hydroxy-3-methylbut-2-enyl diphosphate reductase|nr:4-hydroxy-3-methylbut-2-enyl diphosphate reductase [Bifidobacteriaceae bacterium]